jgi:hypothetical protein
LNLISGGRLPQDGNIHYRGKNARLEINGKHMIEVIKITEVICEKSLFLQSDKGGEFRNSELLKEFKKNGLVKQTVSYHSQMNPVAERTN